MSTQALSAPIRSLSLLLVQTHAARWKSATPEQLTGAHLYLDIAKSGYLFHVIGNVMWCHIVGGQCGTNIKWRRNLCATPFITFQSRLKYHMSCVYICICIYTYPCAYMPMYMYFPFSNIICSPVWKLQIHPLGRDTRYIPLFYNLDKSHTKHLINRADKMRLNDRDARVHIGLCVTSVAT